MKIKITISEKSKANEVIKGCMAEKKAFGIAAQTGKALTYVEKKSGKLRANTTS